MADCVLLLDIGTTTISAEIINTASNRSLIKGAIINSQSEIAEDIISRIDFALKSESNTALLKHKAISSINKLVKKILRQCSISNVEIKQVFCACNSAIHHILLGIDTRTLITPPYKIRQKEEITVCAGVMGLKIKKNIPLTFLPNIGGFVGSDALCVILASGIYNCDKVMLAVDIGTNGEIILGNKDRILVASTAAGPAFEAGHIRNGMLATDGAINSIRINKGKIEYNVIGHAAPKGITGSGLIDACNEMLRNSLMDKSGKMRERELVIYKTSKKKISISQNDIRKLQLAKAAISAAIKTLLKRYGAETSDISRIMLTGSFGNSLNQRSVIGAGLIPKVKMEKVSRLSSGALEGLRLYSRRRMIQKQIPAILSKVEHLPLLGQAFGQEYISSIAFE